MQDILTALVFFFPAAVANATPVIANKIPGLNRWKTPMDFGKSWRGRRVLGNNKTWRGTVLGTFAGGLTGMIIHLINPDFVNKFVADPFSPLLEMIIIGLALGLGALTGDAAESFIKRQIGVKPGESWFPFDQIDYIIGGLLFVWPFVSLPWEAAGFVLSFYFGLHLIVVFISYHLGIRDKPI